MPRVPVSTPGIPVQAHGPNSAESSRHWNVALRSLARNSNVASARAVVRSGPTSIVVSGGWPAGCSPTVQM